MNINDFSFSYKQLKQTHPMMPVFEWEAVIKNNIDNVSYGTKFQHGQQQPDNQAVFNAFLDKNIFKQHWWIEVDNIVKTDNITIEEITIIDEKKPENPNLQIESGNQPEIQNS